MHSSGFETRATRSFIVPAQASHEIQPQQPVGESRAHEAMVEENERATVKSCCAQEQLQRQRAQRQLQRQLQQLPFRNSSMNFNPRRKTYSNLFQYLCEYDNLFLAWEKASKGKTKKHDVKKFKENLKNNLYELQWRLMTGTYNPEPLKVFTVRDPKTRTISASSFPDRTVHHAICNLLEPIFERRFIYDSFANRKGKGTSGIIKRFDHFKGKFKNGYCLKADIKHYFDTVSHEVLLKILGKRIKDAKFMQLIRIILQNHKSEKEGFGMPLGNLTSQFFANIFLSELDNFVKHKLRAKYYLRYVDDFIILGDSPAQLEEWKNKIDAFLSSELKLTLHPDKTKIIPINSGVQLVGLRVFRHHKLLKKSNLRRIWGRIDRLKQTKDKKHVNLSMAGWMGYAMQANTFKLRNRINSLLEARTCC